MSGYDCGACGDIGQVNHGSDYAEPCDCTRKPTRGTLPAEVARAARLVSPEVWCQQYREGEGPMHHAGGGYWHHALLKRADDWEELAKAARVCAEVLPRGN